MKSEEDSHHGLLVYKPSAPYNICIQAHETWSLLEHPGIFPPKQQCPRFLLWLVPEYNSKQENGAKSLTRYKSSTGIYLLQFPWDVSKVVEQSLPLLWHVLVADALYPVQRLLEQSLCFCPAETFTLLSLRPHSCTAHTLHSHCCHSAVQHKSWPFTLFTHTKVDWTHSSHTHRLTLRSLHTHKGWPFTLFTHTKVDWTHSSHTQVDPSLSSHTQRLTLHSLHTHKGCLNPLFTHTGWPFALFTHTKVDPSLSSHTHRLTEPTLYTHKGWPSLLFTHTKVDPTHSSQHTQRLAHLTLHSHKGWPKALHTQRLSQHFTHTKVDQKLCTQRLTQHQTRLPLFSLVSTLGGSCQ